jgi:putative DNA primase/helicase
MIAQTQIEAVPESLLAALAAEAPTQTTASSPAQSSTDPTNGKYTSRLMVDRWLEDRGRDFRLKSEPDGKGRTVYVLNECPFDASHGPDSCIMQAPNGQLSAQCFHNGCHGRGWQDFKQAIGKPNAHHFDPPYTESRSKKRTDVGRMKAVSGGAPPATDQNAVANEQDAGASDHAAPETELPEIQGNKRQLREVTDDAVKAIVARNKPPTIFQRGGLLTRIRICPDDGAPLLEPLVDAALRGVLARVADWTSVREVHGEKVVEDDAPPMEVVKDLANLPGWNTIPLIEGVVECPVFARNGELVQTPGYHPAARLWYQPAAGLKIEPIPECPTQAEITLARDFLLVELLGDFPFKNDASRAHALAALLLPFVRQMINGPTPMHLFDAPLEGTGKTLLCSAITLVSTGRDAEVMTEADSQEEWRKRITATLMDAPTFVLLDNLTRVLDSGSLASVLTSRFWKDRILGFSKTASLPNKTVWLGSGNNTHMSRELIRRTLWSRLDAEHDAPWERKNFRHPNLLVWAKANRGKLIAAALTLCQAWIRGGRPEGKATLGMFESWVAVIGGILDVAGVPGLLANADEFRRCRADQRSEWREFIIAWWQKYAERKVGVEALFELATQEKLLDSVLGDKGERSQRIRMGRALGQAADRVIGEYRLVRAGEDHRQRQQYQLSPTQTAKSTNEETHQWEA